MDVYRGLTEFVTVVNGIFCSDLCPLAAQVTVLFGRSVFADVDIKIKSYWNWINPLRGKISGQRRGPVKTGRDWNNAATNPEHQAAEAGWIQEGFRGFLF